MNRLNATLIEASRLSKVLLLILFLLPGSVIFVPLWVWWTDRGNTQAI